LDSFALAQRKYVSKLLAHCRDALKSGRLEAAKTLAARALAGDPFLAIRDSFVYLMWMLSEPCPPVRSKHNNTCFGIWSAGGETISSSTSPSADGLIEQCRQALQAGKIGEAEIFASQAFALDPLRVAAHPLVYKMHLLSHLNTRAVQLEPCLPRIDPNIVPAFHEILEPSDTDLACCEEEQETTANPLTPGVCLDVAQQKDKGFRVRCQLGRFCFRLDCNQQGHGCLLLGLGIDSGDPVSQFFGTALEGVFKAVDSAIKPDEKDQRDMD